MTLKISWSSQSESYSEEGELSASNAEHTLVFDAVLSESHEGTSVLTEHAVESGAPISDHKRANPARLTIEALVTNTPLLAPPASGYGEGPAVTAEVRKDEDVKANVVIFSASFDRLADVETTLRRLRLEATPVTVSTRVRTYEQVQVVSVTCPREPEDGDSLRFQIEFQEVRVAQSRTVDAPRPREPRGRRRTDAGDQEASTQETQRTSTLQRAQDEYNAQREAGASRTDALTSALGSAFGG